MSDDDLRGRFGVVLVRLDKLLKEIGPTVVKIGQDRGEVSLISEEMRRRGLIDIGEPGKDGTPTV
jgi:hypothetical protein